MALLYDYKNNILAVGGGGSSDTDTTSGRAYFTTSEAMKVSGEQYARLGSLDFDFETKGYVCKSVPALKQPKLIESDRKDDLGLFQCIDQKGRFLFWNNALTRIMCLEKWEDTSLKEVWNLKAMSDDFILGRYIYLMRNGNLLILGQRQGDNEVGEPLRIYVLDTKTNTLTMTYKARSLRLRPLTRGCIAMNDNIIWYSEYGTNSIATKIWRSEDYGMTWIEAHDFMTEPNIDEEKLHCHAIFYDPYLDRIWLSTGDRIQGGKSCKKIWWSDDNGDTWSHKAFDYLYGPTNSAYDNPQLFTIYAGKDFMLFGGDDHNNCIYRSIRAYNDVILDRVYFYAPEETGKVTQYSGEIKRLQNGLVLFPIVNGDAGNWPQRTRLLGTFDGVRFYELFTDTENNVTYPIANDGITEERDGYLYFAYVSADDDTGKSQITHLVRFLMPEIV